MAAFSNGAINPDIADDGETAPLFATVVCTYGGGGCAACFPPHAASATTSIVLTRYGETRRVARDAQIQARDFIVVLHSGCNVIGFEICVVRPP